MDPVLRVQAVVTQRQHAAGKSARPICVPGCQDDVLGVFKNFLRTAKHAKQSLNTQETADIPLGPSLPGPKSDSEISCPLYCPLCSPFPPPPPPAPLRIPPHLLRFLPSPP